MVALLNDKLLLLFLLIFLLLLKLLFSCSNIISIEVLKSFLWDKNHDSIKISDGGGTSFGTDFKYILKDNKEKNLNYITVNRQSQITKPSQPKEPIKGKIDYVIKVITDYDKVTLNAKETGRKFTLNGNVYILKDRKSVV